MVKNRKKLILALFIVLFISLTAMFAVAAPLEKPTGEEFETKAHEPTVSWVSFDSDFYEFSEGNYVLKITNGNLSNDTIVTVDLDVTPMTILGWDSGCSLNPSNSSLMECIVLITGSNYGGGSSTLGFMFVAPEVSATTAYSVSVTTTDDAFDSETSTLSITVLNDSIAPYYTLISPTNRFIVQDSTSQSFHIAYGDNESGIDSVLMYHDIGSTLDWTENMSTSVVDINGDVNKTFHGHQNTPCVTYFFELKDKAGNFKNKNELGYSGDEHGLFLDFFVPSVDLTFPLNNQYTNENSYTFRTDVDDDEFNSTAACVSEFSVNATCVVFVNNLPLGSDVYSSNVSNAGIVANISGLSDNFYYDWYIQCTDASGRVANSTTRQFGIDRTPPVITPLNFTNETVIVNGTILVFNVSDALSGVDAVWYNATESNGSLTNYSIDTSSWTYGDHHVLNISATDNAGNVITETYNVTIDNKGPVIDLLSPDDGDFGNGFLINASDEYSEPVTCTLYVGNATNNVLVSIVSENLTSVSLVDGIYDWNVTCQDNLSNSNFSETRTVRFDTHSPIVTEISPTEGWNSNTTSVDFTYNVTDLSLDACWLVIDGVPGTANFFPSGSLTATLVDNNTAHTWYVACNDTAGNADGVSGNQNVFYDTTVPGFNPVLNITIKPSVTVSYNKATITWTMDETTTNYVLLGVTNKSYTGNTNTAASVTPTGLSQTTTYTYYVKSCDAAGVANDTTHCVTAGPYTFTTTKQNNGGGGSGGGSWGGGVAVCMESWKCEDWSDCSDGKKTRTCEDTSACGTESEMPRLEMSCTLPKTTEESIGSSAKLASEEALEESGNKITGAVTGPWSSMSTGAKIGLSAFVVAVVLGAVAMTVYSRRKKKKLKEFNF